MDLQPLEVKDDERGALVAAFKLPNDGQVFYIVIRPNETRGNHYHMRKTECFLVIYGSAEMQIKDRLTGNVNKVSTHGDEPIVITVAPNHTHNISANEEGCIALVWVNEQFNPDDADTFPEEI